MSSSLGRLLRPAWLALVLACLGGTAAWSFDIQHIPIPNATQGRAIPIDAVVVGTEPVSVMYLFFRQPGGPYRPLQMTGSGSQFSAEIPRGEISMQGVEYYLDASGTAGSRATFPPVNAVANPLHVSVLPNFEGFKVVPVYPEPEGVVDDARPDIVIYFSPGQGGLDRKSVRVLLDGAILTRQALITDEFVKVRPQKNLEWGPHDLFVNAKSRDGVWVVLELHFYVRAPIKRMVSFRGSATLEASQVDVLKKPTSETFLAIPRPPGGRGLAGRLETSGRIGDESVQVSVRKTPVDRGEQPSPDFYFMELRGHAHRLSLGDATARMTDFSAPYLRLRGGDAAADIGPVKLEALGGLARRAIFNSEFNSGTYERMVYGGRASLRLAGGEIGAQGIFGQDDLNSLPAGAVARALEGWMAGMNAAFPLPKSFRFTAEGATSRLIPDRTKDSRQIGDAWDARVEQRIESFSWSAAFREVSPNYFSPGGPAVQNDYRAYEVGFSLPVSSGSFRGNATVSRDNVRHQKPSTLNSRTIGLGIGFPQGGKRPGFDFSASDTRQKNDPPGTFPVDSETLGFNFSTNKSWTKVSGSMNLGYTRFRDFSPQPLASDSDGTSASLSISGQVLQVQWGLSGGGNANRVVRTNDKSAFIFGAANLGRRLFWGLSAQLRANVNRGTNSAGTLDTLQLGYDAGLGWSWRRLRADLTGKIVRFEDRVVAGRDYEERAVTLSTTYNF